MYRCNAGYLPTEMSKGRIRVGGAVGHTQGARCRPRASSSLAPQKGIRRLAACTLASRSWCLADGSSAHIDGFVPSCTLTWDFQYDEETQGRFAHQQECGEVPEISSVEEEGLDEILCGPQETETMTASAAGSRLDRGHDGPKGRQEADRKRSSAKEQAQETTLASTQD